MSTSMPDQSNSSEVISKSSKLRSSAVIPSVPYNSGCNCFWISANLARSAASSCSFFFRASSSLFCLALACACGDNPPNKAFLSCSLESWMNPEPFAAPSEHERNALFGGLSPQAQAKAKQKREEEARKKKEQEEAAERARLAEIQKQLQPELYGTEGITADDLNFDDLDMTSEELDWSGIDVDMTNLKRNSHILKIIMEGADLRSYSKQVDQDLWEVQQGTISDYLQESKAIAVLYEQMTASDTVLGQIEDILSRFQTDIGNVGSEIKKLQDECYLHQIGLTNRKGVQKKVKQFIEDVSVSDDLQKVISHGEVNSIYLRYLTEFNKKMAYVESHKMASNNQIRSIADIEPDLEDLKYKAVKKVKSFLLQVLYASKTYDLMKKNHLTLLEYNYLYQFLFKHAPDVANEVKNVYKDTAGKLYIGYFKAAVATATKLQYEIANKNDLLGIEEGRMSSIFSGRKPIKNKTSVFAMGVRQQMVDEMDEIAPALVDDGEKKPYEFFFKSLLYLLMQSVTVETKFTQDFFLVDDGNSFDTDIFGRVLQMYNENIDYYISTTYDSIAVFLMIVLVSKYKSIMNKRLIYGLDSFFDGIYQKLASRFFQVFDLNVQSVKTAQAKDLSSVDFAPHYVTRRYAEFQVSILTLANLLEDKDSNFMKQLNQQMGKLREEIEKLLIRLADSKHKDWRSKTIFLMNNYDLILNVMGEKNLTSAETAQFQKLLDIKGTDYAGDELNRSFGRLITFVKDYGQHVSGKDTSPTGEEKISAREGTFQVEFKLNFFF
eukprot:TRINITY_DN4747_c0_g1_i1.p1 TRINITY_DN4747_c0_g1~~TRINITY_DN4747_c0_g1_i1.p1  ORF type:complete len:777 (-),score=235.67 TRINITY_DN4747_c0_g1_i1:133-2463(-)